MVFIPRLLLACVLLASPAIASGQADSNYLLWTLKQAEQMRDSRQAAGRIGNGRFRATWLTPEAIRGAARLAQVAEMINVEETDSLVQEAEAAGDTIVRLELDERVMATLKTDNEWHALLQPAGSKAGAAGAVTGTSSPALGDMTALKKPPVPEDRYTTFWLVFPLHRPDGASLFGPSVRTAELVLVIGTGTARVQWPIPPSLLP